MDNGRAEQRFREAGARRWGVSQSEFVDALERSVARAFAGRTPADSEIDRYCGSLHLADLALACACASGHESAWDHFVLEFRPALYRAADAIAPGGGAREVADALYAELFGVKERGTAGQSLFHYFHGRSSLATWLRSLVTQRYVDRLRATRRLDPLPEDASSAAIPARPSPPDPDRPRFAAAMRTALGLAIAALVPRDRLRLGCYYAQEMTLAQIGRLTGEHEATVSRHLTRTRRTIRDAVEQRLRDEHGFGEREITECFASISADAGAIDLGEWMPADDLRKDPGVDRSRHEDPS